MGPIDLSRPAMSTEPPIMIRDDRVLFDFARRLKMNNCSTYMNILTGIFDARLTEPNNYTIILGVKVSTFDSPSMHTPDALCPKYENKEPHGHTEWFLRAHMLSNSKWANWKKTRILNKQRMGKSLWQPNSDIEDLNGGGVTLTQDNGVSYVTSKTTGARSRVERIDLLCQNGEIWILEDKLCH